MPFGAIYLCMGTTPNPDCSFYIKKQRIGSHQLIFPGPMERWSFYPTAHIPKSLNMWSAAPGTRHQGPDENEKVDHAECEAQRRIQTDAGELSQKQERQSEVKHDSCAVRQTHSNASSC